MTHVVTDNCSQCRFTDCAVTCPVQAFHGDASRLYIDPDACIDCNACIPACPVNAIEEECDLAEDKRHWVGINSDRAKELPIILSKQTPLPTADERRRQLQLS